MELTAQHINTHVSWISLSAIERDVRLEMN